MTTRQKAFISTPLMSMREKCSYCGKPSTGEWVGDYKHWGRTCEECCDEIMFKCPDHIPTIQRVKYLIKKGVLPECVTG